MLLGLVNQNRGDIVRIHKSSSVLWLLLSFSASSRGILPFLMLLLLFEKLLSVHKLFKKEMLGLEGSVTASRKKKKMSVVF